MNRVVPLLVATACLAACGGGTPSTQAPAPVAVTPPPVANVNFTAFTKNVLTVKSETAVPVTISAAEFAFPDNDNPSAFATVLPGT